MGQYFRKWLNEEGLIEENSVPKEGEVRFNARDKQRCRATARYFASGLLPLADINVEYPAEANGPEDFMSPVLKFYSEDYARDAVKQVADMGGAEGFAGRLIIRQRVPHQLEVPLAGDPVHQRRGDRVIRAVL